MSKELASRWKISSFSSALDDQEMTLEWIRKMSSVNAISRSMSFDSIEKDKDLSWR